MMIFNNKTFRRCVLLIVLAGLLIGDYVNGINTINHEPVLWRPTTTPVTSGHNDVHVLIKLQTPCDILNTETVHHDLLPEMKKKCEEIYGKYFLSEVEKMCPRGSFIEVDARQKRFVFSSVLFAVFTLVGVIAVGLGVTAQTTANIALSHVSAVEDRSTLSETKLEELTHRVNLAEVAIKNLNLRMDRQEQDFQLLKYKQTGTTYAVSYITTRMLMGHQILQEAQRAWKSHNLHAPFFDFINFSLPCGDDCPTRFAVAKQCRLSYDRTKLMMHFTTPVINQTLQLAEADAFKMMHQTSNLTCPIEYSGPSNVVVSTTHDCIYGVNVKSTDLILSPSQGCQSESALPETSKYFALGKCRAKQPLDALDFIQVKPYMGYNHVYCWGNNITVGGVVKPCPNQTFILPETAKFSINQQFNTVGEFKLNHQEQLDPTFSHRINWHLQPKIHMPELLDTVLGNRSENNNNVDFVLWITISATIIGVFAIVGVILCIVCYRDRQKLVQMQENQNRFDLDDIPNEYEM